MTGQHETCLVKCSLQALGQRLFVRQEPPHNSTTMSVCAVAASLTEWSLFSVADQFTPASV